MLMSSPPKNAHEPVTAHVSASEPKLEPASESPSESKPDLHDKCKQVVMFHNNLCRFLKSLKGVLPEYGDKIKRAANYYKSIPRAQYLEELTKMMDPHMKYISEQDEGIFTTDYQKHDLYLIPSLNFTKMWKMLESGDFESDEKFQESTKLSIYKHLQAIFISANMAQQQIGTFNYNMEKQKKFLMNMLENLKLDEDVKKRIEELKKEDADAKKDGGFSMESMSKLLGEDNLIYQLAKEISDELDMGNEDIENPVDAINSLFANGGKKMQDLIVTVGDKLESKIASGEIDKDKAMSDARKMKDKMSKIPGFSKLVNNRDMFKDVSDKYNEMPKKIRDEFPHVPDLLKKPNLEWTEEETKYFETYVDRCQNTQSSDNKSANVKRRIKKKR